MRARLTGLVRKFPSLHASQCLIPWLTVLLTLAGGCWVLFEYSASNKASRIDRTLQLYQNFTKQLADGKSLYDNQMELVEKARGIVLEINTEYQLKEERREHIEKNLAEVYEKDKRIVYNVLMHYTQVISCVEYKGCHKHTAFEIYGSDMLIFVNTFCSFLKKTSTLWNNEPADTPIVRFLAKDTKSELLEKKLMCQHHKRFIKRQD